MLDIKNNNKVSDTATSGDIFEVIEEEKNEEYKESDINGVPLTAEEIKNI